MLKSARNFVSVNAEELNQGSPLFIEEQLFFQLNGTTQQVVLETFGQNVEIFRGKTILNDSTLTADKPYIIYDSLAVISGKTLTLAAGFISIKMQSMYMEIYMRKELRHRRLCCEAIALIRLTSQVRFHIATWLGNGADFISLEMECTK